MDHNWFDIKGSNYFIESIRYLIECDLISNQIFIVIYIVHGPWKSAKINKKLMNHKNVLKIRVICDKFQ